MLGVKAPGRLVLQKINEGDFMDIISDEAALLIAIHYNAYELFKYILMKMGDSARSIVNKEIEEGYRLIHFAAVNGSVEIGDLLIEIGADFNIPFISRDPSKNGEPPIITALKLNNLDFVKMLLTHGVDTGVTQDGSNLLHLVATYKRIAVARELMETVEDKYAKNNEGFTPLQLALIADKEELFYYFLGSKDGTENGIIDPIDKEGNRVVEILDREGNTLLHLAARYDRRRIFEILTRMYKLDPGAINFVGDTPLKVAEVHCSWSIVNLLKGDLSVKRTGNNGGPSDIDNGIEIYFRTMERDRYPRIFDLSRYPSEFYKHGDRGNSHTTSQERLQRRALHF